MQYKLLLNNVVSWSRQNCKLHRHAIWAISLYKSPYISIWKILTLWCLFFICSWNNAEQYCYVGRYYFTRIWKILHWKYHGDICKKHSRNIFPLCHIVTNTSRTLVKIWSRTRDIFDAENSIFSLLNLLCIRRKVNSNSASARWTISRYKLATWEAEAKGES